MAKMPSTKLQLAIVTLDDVERRIHDIRGQKVMLDSDLAALYGVRTSNMNTAVKRNSDRFPEDFRFQLTEAELENLRFQIGISSSHTRGGRRYLPYVFTEQGVAMLSTVLNSDRAVQVNIAIMRAFVNTRRLVASNEEIKKKLAAIERKLGDHDESFKTVFAAIRAMMRAEGKSEQIGYIRKKKALKK
jgi:ORF6N domain